MCVSTRLRCFPRSGLGRAQKRIARRALHILSKYLCLRPTSSDFPRCGDSAVNKTHYIHRPTQIGRGWEPCKSRHLCNRNVTSTPLTFVRQSDLLICPLSSTLVFYYLLPMGMELSDLHLLIFLFQSFVSFWTQNSRPLSFFPFLPCLPSGIPLDSPFSSLLYPLSDNRVFLIVSPHGETSGYLKVIFDTIRPLHPDKP